MARAHTKFLAPETISIISSRRDSALYPYIGSRPIAAITARRCSVPYVASRRAGGMRSAHRVRALAGRVFRYAVATGRAQHDVAADLKGALAPVKSRNFASVTDPLRVGELMPISLVRASAGVLSASGADPVQFASRLICTERREYGRSRNRPPALCAQAALPGLLNEVIHGVSGDHLARLPSGGYHPAQMLSQPSLGKSGAAPPHRPET